MYSTYIIWIDLLDTVHEVLMSIYRLKSISLNVSVTPRLIGFLISRSYTIIIIIIFDAI